MKYAEILSEINKDREIVSHALEHIQSFKDYGENKATQEIHNLKVQISNLKDLKKQIKNA